MNTHLGHSVSREVLVEVAVEITVNNPDVFERVTGPDGDEWRSAFYNLHTESDVIAHLASNFVLNQIADVSRLEGWGDCGSDDVTCIHQGAQITDWEGETIG